MALVPSSQYWNIPEPCKKNGSASICAVIAYRSTKTRDFDNEIENHRNQNYLLECTICNICTPKNGWLSWLIT